MSNSKRPTGPTAAGVGVLMDAAGWGALGLPIPYADVAGGGLLVAGSGLVIAGGYAWYRTRRGTRAVIARMESRARRQGGVAGTWDHVRVSSALAMRRRATVLRPSLGELSRWRRWRTPVTAYATCLAQVGRWRVWSPCEDVTLRVGGPRKGKSAALASHIVDAPGAAVVTSTRKDLVLLTAPVRAQYGPVHIFNPNPMIDWGSTVKWSPLVGCRDAATAQRRAADMIPASGGEEAERWDSQARRVLGILMHAAALGDLPMRAVLRWVSDPSEDAAQTVATILAGQAADTPEVRALVTAARQFFTTNDRTRSSITTTIMPALQWLTNARAAALGDADVTEDLLDIGQMISQRATLYLLGGEDGAAAPLIAALTAEIAYQARSAAGRTPTDRLDPPLTMVLDEAALVCPVDLPRWTADMGGKGVTLHIGVQGRSQLRRIWGEAGAADILNNSGTVLVFGGTKDPSDLEAWSKLAGERVELSEQTDSDGKTTGYTTHRVPALSVSQIQQLGKHQVMIVRDGMPVSIGQAPRSWKRRDIRRAMRRAPYAPPVETHYEEQLAEERAEA